MSINWNNIRTLENSQNEGFEELVCQLARKENIPNLKKFIRKGKPDAGVECFWILDNDDEIAWQAKYFTSSLEDTQWSQIDNSIRTVLDKHPKLKKYYIAIPNDPPDARIEGQTSMLDKWDSRVTKWKGWALEKGLTVEFIPWWSSDLIERLQKPENDGLTYFWFNKEEFTDEWCKEQSELSISDLGKRYTPKLNIKLEISEIFNGISRDKDFLNQVTTLFDDFLIMGKKTIPRIDDLDSCSSALKKELKAIHDLFSSTDFQGIETLPVNEFLTSIENTDQIVTKIRDSYLEQESKLQTNPDDYRYYKKFGSEISHIRDFENSIYSLSRFLEDTTMKLANHPFLLLEGEAGIGKSHLLADIISTRTKDNLVSLLFLGQHFVTDEDPWTQIFKKNDINCSVDEFLGALNSKAQIRGRRIILFIDAVNEGRGKYFWNNNIKSFLTKVKKYKWLGVVMSIRTSYSNLIFPKDEIKEDEIIRYTHYGFRNQEYEATKLFFNNYGIELPSIPLLHPEFQNPLFLLLFCEGLNKAGYTKIPDGLQGITAIIDFFITSVNNILSKPTRLDYPRSINIVRKAIESLIAYKIDNHLRYVPFEQAFVLFNKMSHEFSTKKRGLIDELISEGILSKNLFWNPEKRYEEGVYLVYERFEDHLTASYIIDTNPEIEEAFKEGGTLFNLVKDEISCNINKGVIEALTIQIPEKKGKEFYEYVPHIKDSYPIIECFVQSLLWRKNETTSKKLVGYVNSTVLKYQGTFDLFWDTILSVTSTPDHYFNAYSLHNNLMGFSLPERDAWWTIYLKQQFYDGSPVKRLIDWSWNTNDKSHISDESVKLTSITLSWFHTSTNRKLRDSATKALICLLENRIHILIELLKLFEKVNDPYVYERLFAVAYGCSVRTEQTDKLSELSNYIFETIFNDEVEVYPHILLRDYARGVIEFTYYRGYDLEFDISMSRPPYKSSFIGSYPKNEEINELYEPKDEEGHYGKEKWGVTAILWSMATEHGARMYGDFGRYVFQSAFRNWDIDPNDLSNLAIEWIFKKYGYDSALFNDFDLKIGTGRGRNTFPHERIGKKYQWIALYEMLARVSDNCKKYADWSFLHSEEDAFQGPWEPYVRDIDPTMIINKTGSYDEEALHDFWWSQEKYMNWEFENEEWIKLIEDLPNSKKIINIVNKSGEEWLVLEGYPEWAESKKVGDEKWDKPHKRIWYQLRSYLITDDDYVKIKDWASNQDFMGRWMPESSSRYQVFSREYYWSPAYNYFYNKEYYGGMELKEIHEKITEDSIGNVILTTNNFLWEEEFDQSKEDSIHFLKPSKYIFEHMKLVYSKKEGEFTDDTGEVICFAPSVYFDSQSYLIIKKYPLLKFLKESKLRLLWTVLGEKSIIGGHSNGDVFYGRLEISGVYYLNENNEVEGKVSTKVT